MKDDLGKYIQRRKRADTAFAKGFESGYAKFKYELTDRSEAPKVGRKAKPKGFEP